MVGVVTVDDDQAGKRGSGDEGAQRVAPAGSGTARKKAAKPPKAKAEKPAAAPKKKPARTPRAKKAE